MTEHNFLETPLPPKPAKSTANPPYLLGLLGLIPLVGFFVGIGLTLYGILKYKNRTLTIIGIACMLFSAWGFNFSFKTQDLDKALEKSVQMHLTALVKYIEFYKLEHQGMYPDSLQELDTKEEFIFIEDHTQVGKGRKNTYFNYKNLGEKYLLFSSGTDGIPNTADDIYPKVNIHNTSTGWTRSE